MSARWSVFVRDASLNRVGQIDDYQGAEITPRFNDVGTWTLDIDSRHPLAAQVTLPGYGVEFVRDGSLVVLSGPVTGKLRTRTGPSGGSSGVVASRSTLALNGVDDNVWIRRRLAHPQPASSAPPYNSAEYDVRTGTCSTILGQYIAFNLGSSAIMARQISPAVALAPDLVLGTSVTGRARWQNLLDLLKELAIAGGDLGFRLHKVGTTYEFEVYQPVDRSTTVRFSEELETLQSYKYSEDVAETNYVFVGGGGEGTARTILERQDSESRIEWNARIESFRDRRDTTDATEMTQSGDEVLSEGATKTSLSIDPIDIAGQEYGTHYGLGDKVTVVIDGESISDVVRSVNIKLTPDGPQKILPQIGTPGRSSVLRIFDRLRAAERRVARLERR